MRDILQYCADDIHITEEGETRTMIRIFHIPKHFSEQYERQDILYSIKKLIELNYIVISDLTWCNNKWDASTFIYDVSYQGHKYLESFAND